MIVELNEKNFDQNIKNGLKLVEFYASWCGYCKKERPVMEELSANNIWIGTVDVDTNPDLAARYGKLPESLSPSDALEEIAKIRGLLQRGGVPDIPRVSQAFINDYRKGYLTKLPLDEL